MRIVALTKFKQADLFNALRHLGWTQAKLSKKSKVPMPILCDIINLKVAPTEKQANNIQKALGKQGIVLDVMGCWPEGFKGIGKKRHLTLVSEIEYNPSVAIDSTSAHILPPPQDLIETTEGNYNEHLVSNLMTSANLTRFERDSVSVRYGLKLGERKSMRCTAVEIGSDEKGVDNAITRALGKLRNAAHDTNMVEEE